MKFCSHCGNQLNDSDVFCPNCGTPSAVDEGTQAAPETNYSEPAYTQQAYTGQDNGQPVYGDPAMNTAPKPEKSKVTAGILGILLGSLGIHKFYLGYTVPALIMLLVSVIGGIFLFGIPAMVMGIIGLIEGIFYLVKTDEDFDQTYVQNKKEWF